MKLGQSLRIAPLFEMAKVDAELAMMRFRGDNDNDRIDTLLDRRNVAQRVLDGFDDA